ncbi:MAG: anaerobic ribonucleoside-triphosphate reductase activating protein [Bowdeniella nasicola]|nr:anaerobic ribonucleoside-triphosphate reductase activating protein [Bowdeniella nasicola]
MAAPGRGARGAVALGLPHRRMDSKPRRRATACASDLPIAGITALSTVDWPGKLVATVFVQGCPWRCTYCHNREILDCNTAGEHRFSEVETLLARRSGLLDGVVFSGGEATRTASVVPALARVRQLGFSTGLHTAGAYRATLRAALEHLDWVGFDVKGLPAHYPDVAQVGEAMGERAWQVLAEVLASGVETEVRLTTYPGAHRLDDIIAIAQRAFDLGAPRFALQQARGEGGRGIFLAEADASVTSGQAEFDRAAAALTQRWNHRVIIRK